VEAAMILWRLGVALDNLALYDAAITHYEKALNLFMLLEGRPTTNAATLMKSIGLAMLNAGYIENAIGIMESSLKVYSHHYADTHDDVMDLMALLYQGHAESGNLPAAAFYLEKLIDATRERNGNEDPLLSGMMLSLGRVYLNQRRYALAMDYLGGVLAKQEELFGDADQSLFEPLFYLARAHFELHDYRIANVLQQRAVNIGNSFMGETAPLLITAKHNLAMTKNYIGEFEQAEKLFLELYQLEKNNPSVSDPFLSAVPHSLGILYSNRKLYQKAEVLFKEALRRRLNHQGLWDAETGNTIKELGTLYLAQGKLEQAKRLLETALKIRKRTLNLNDPKLSDGIYTLAVLYTRLNHTDRALELFEEYARVDNQALREMFEAADERQRMQLVRTSVSPYITLLSFALNKAPQNQKALRAAMNMLLSRKGIVLDAEARAKQILSDSKDPEIKSEYRELLSVQIALDILYREHPTLVSAEERHQILLETIPEQIASSTPSPKQIIRVGKAVIARFKDQLDRSTFEALEQTIHEEVEASMELYEYTVQHSAKKRAWKATNTHEVASSLEPRSALIEFVRARNFNWEDQSWGEQSQYLGLVLFADGRIAIRNLGRAETIDALIKRELSIIREVPVDSLDGTRQMEAAKRLYDALWKPVADLTNGLEEIILSPDSTLNLVPFNALMKPNGQFLIEDHTINYVTSGRDLVDRAEPVQAEADLFLAANPDFNLVEKSDSQPHDATTTIYRSREALQDFTPLPGTALEAEIIPGLIRGKEQIILTGPEATEAAVLKARNPLILHLATHGFFLPDQEMQKTMDETADNSKPSESLPYENPLLRSGLALAGANQAQSSNSALDGILTAQEVTGMSLRGTDLVTLSACETGVGEVRAGEGVFGLRRAFVLAGARHLLMSLWSVSDEITAKQMASFYRLYYEGYPPQEGLRMAQLETIQSLREAHQMAPPGLWAAFMIQSRRNATTLD